MPGAEVLGADLGSDHFAQVVVDVGALHVPPAAAVSVAQQLRLAGAGLAQAPDDLRDIRVDDGLQPFLAAFGDVFEGDDVVANADVVGTQGGKPKGLVLLRIGFPADAEEVEVEQPKRTGKDALPRITTLVEVRGDGFPGHVQTPSHL